MTERTRITIDDLYQLGWLETPRVSPDGRTVAYVRVSVDRVRNRYRRAIWLAALDGGPPRRLTSGLHSDTAPAWSPDGRQIAFVSTRELDSPQVYVIPVGGGEARRLTALPNGATAPAWSPAGRQIAFLGRANAAERAAEDSGETPELPETEWELQQLRAQQQHDEELRFDPRVVSRLPYRGGTSFFDDRREHIYLLHVHDEKEAGDELQTSRRLTDADMHFSAPVWTPDGAAILTTATRDPEADAIFAFYEILRIPVPAEGRADSESLTEPGFSYYDPQPSPDGRWIALRRLPDDRPLAEGARIVLLPAAGGEPRDLTADVDLSVEAFGWQPNGDALLFTAGWRGDQALHRVSFDQAHSNVAPLLPLPRPGRLIAEFDVGKDGSVAFVAGNPENPCELFVRRPDGEEIQLTHINSAWLAERALAPLEEIVYSAPDGRDVQGWVLRPPDYDATQRYPLAVHIHGGPHLMWGPGIRSMWHEWQATAAQGYIVFFCNPRGSEGYGEAWRDGIHANWGIGDMHDILSGIAALIARGDIDPERIGVTGGSYGGYMTTWLIAHDDRFSCAVSARGVYNLFSEHNTSDAHELIEIEFDGYPWERQEQLWAHSPLAHAHRITTPLLLLHSEQDYRVPISEAEQLFSVLRRRKQIVELVRYPREGHELTRSGEPRHRADHMRRTLEWFDRYCKPGS